VVRGVYDTVAPCPVVNEFSEFYCGVPQP